MMSGGLLEALSPVFQGTALAFCNFEVQAAQNDATNFLDRLLKRPEVLDVLFDSAEEITVESLAARCVTDLWREVEHAIQNGLQFCFCYGCRPVRHGFNASQKSPQFLIGGLKSLVLT